MMFRKTGKAGHVYQVIVYDKYDQVKKRGQQKLLGSIKFHDLGADAFKQDEYREPWRPTDKLINKADKDQLEEILVFCDKLNTEFMNQRALEVLGALERMLKTPAGDLAERTRKLREAIQQKAAASKP